MRSRLHRRSDNRQDAAIRHGAPHSTSAHVAAWTPKLTVTAADPASFAFLLSACQSEPTRSTTASMPVLSSSVTSTRPRIAISSPSRALPGIGEQDQYLFVGETSGRCWMNTKPDNWIQFCSGLSSDASLVACPALQEFPIPQNRLKDSYNRSHTTATLPPCRLCGRPGACGSC